MNTTAITALCLAAALVLLPSGAAASRLPAILPHGQPPRRVLRVVLAAPPIAGVVAGFVIGGPAGALAGALVTAVVRRRRTQARLAAAAAATVEQLAESLGRICEELRVGGHPAAALAGVVADGPLARDVLAPAATAAALGDDVAAALRRTGATRPAVTQDLHRLASAWSLAERHGVPLAELLAGARSDLRWRVRFGASVRSQLAGPRATATVLTCLPLLGLGLGQLLGADPLGVLRSGLIGQALVVVGVMLAATGALWSESIVDAAVPR